MSVFPFFFILLLYFFGFDTLDKKEHKLHAQCQILISLNLLQYTILHLYYLYNKKCLNELGADPRFLNLVVPRTIPSMGLMMPPTGLRLLKEPLMIPGLLKMIVVFLWWKLKWESRTSATSFSLL